MTTSTRLAPVRRGVRRPPTPARAPGPPRGAPPRPRKPVSFERILLWSLLFSAAAHLLILVVSPLFIAVGVPPGDGARGARSSAPVAVSLRAIVPVPADPADAAGPDNVEGPRAAGVDAPRNATKPARALADAEPAAADRSGGGAAESAVDPAAGPARRSVGDALRPGYSDGRLWVNPRALRIEREPSRHEAYMEHLQARIDAANDSTYGRGPDTDWTYTDDEGRRWGISEKGVHLGGITIPRQLLPIPRTGTNQEQEENRERARQREEIIRQEEARAREEAREESRKAAERRRKGGGGGG